MRSPRWEAGCVCVCAATVYQVVHNLNQPFAGPGWMQLLICPPDVCESERRVWCERQRGRAGAHLEEGETGKALPREYVGRKNRW